jgi:hypothetical protein
LSIPNALSNEIESSTLSKALSNASIGLTIAKAAAFSVFIKLSSNNCSFARLVIN